MTRTIALENPLVWLGQNSAFQTHLWLKLDCSSSCTEWHKQPFWGPFLFHTRPGRRGSIYKWNHLLKAEYGFYFYLNMTSLLFSVVFVICLFNKALTCHIFIWLNQNWDEMMRFTQDWYRSAGRSFYHILRQMYLCFLRQRASCVQTQQTSNQEVTTTTVTVQSHQVAWSSAHIVTFCESKRWKFGTFYVHSALHC